MSNEPTGYATLSDEQLEKLPTKRLLVVFKKMQIDAGYAQSYYVRHDEYQNNREHYENVIARTDFIKKILDTREHVEKK